MTSSKQRKNKALIKEREEKKYEYRVNSHPGRDWKISYWGDRRGYQREQLKSVKEEYWFQDLRML